MTASLLVEVASRFAEALREALLRMPRRPSVKGSSLIATGEQGCGVAVRCTGQASRRVLGVLAVKGKILTIDLPHELRAILNSLFELLLRVAF